jgi:hypothetical protein
MRKGREREKGGLENVKRKKGERERKIGRE